MKNAIHDFGNATRRFGKRTINVAEDLGPKRLLIGLAIVGAAIGGTVFLVRYVRARRAEQLVDIQPEGVPTGAREPVHARAH